MMMTRVATRCFEGCHPHLRGPCKLNKPYIAGISVPLRLKQHAQHLPDAVMNTEVSTADSWALEARAAMLSLKVEELEECIQRDSQNAWVAICEPERLFALSELCKLMGIDVTAALQLVQQVPGLLDVPSRKIEDNVRGLQSLLQLPRSGLLQLLDVQPDLLLQGPRAVEVQLQRLAWALGLSAAGPDALRLLQLLPWLGPEAVCDHYRALQQIEPFVTSLSLSSSIALVLLEAEMLAGHSLQPVLSAEGLQALSSEWGALSEEVGLTLGEVMTALAVQLTQPGARYLVGSAQLLRADITAVQAACQLEPSTVCRMLLSAPRLVAVPASFWQLLLQYMLFLVPRWRQQLEAMTAGEAATLLAQLFDEVGGDVDDAVGVSSQEALFNTADADYNQELAVLEALLDQGIQAPRFTAPGQITAGRVWRLLYLCNPRMAAQPSAEDVPRAANSSTNPWSWVLNLQLPLPLINQMQQQGALSCNLPGAGEPAGSLQVSSRDKKPRASSNSSGTAVTGDVERVEGLWEAVAADSADFCTRHPGYAHWLHNAAFELEWANSKAAVPLVTWDV